MTLDQNKTPSPSDEPKFLTACGGQIKDPSMYPSAEHRGEIVFFCTQACLDAFLLDPDPFMAGEVEHPV
ncbi:MAG: hypothetical protein KJZ77_04545 [Anaerolineales bacterium]|jgi:YHS domain-containing protein|nr:hypothetical protein [Anaerolineales bacterium]